MTVKVRNPRTALADAVKAADQVDDQIAQAVADARGAGCSWYDIAGALGITQPYTTRHYGPLIERLTPRADWPEGDHEKTALAALRRAHAKRDKAELKLVRAVADARNQGMTWSAIAEVLGASQPNVVAKFGPLIRQITKVTPSKARLALLDGDAAEKVKMVAAARDQGTTWAEIAKRLGMAQPNAVAKFKPLVEVSTRFEVDLDAFAKRPRWRRR